MALTLNRHDLRRLEIAQQVLLSPSSHDDARAWCNEVVAAVAALFRDDGVLFNVAYDGAVISTWGSGLAPFEEILHEIVGGVQRGAIRYEDDDLDHALDVRRRSKLEVWSNRMIERLYHVPLEEMPFYEEFMVATGYGSSASCACMTAPHWRSDCSRSTATEAVGSYSSMPGVRKSPAFTRTMRPRSMWRRMASFTC